MKRNFFICAVIIIFCFTFSKYLNLQNKLPLIKKVVVIKEEEKKLKPKILSIKNKIIIPVGFRPVLRVIHQSNYIGTADHPTVDGGVINSVEFMSVSHETPLVESNDHSNILREPPHFDKQTFSDSWVTNSKVKRILTEAAKQGKLDYVLRKSDQMNLPASIAILPLVESEYHTNAVSPKGAIGDWQLMPVTAKEYGLRDRDRLNFAISTDTALKLLSSLHHQFNNWDLAFAAYNAGSNRIAKALQKNPKVTNVNDLDIPIETKNYLNRIKAVSSSLEGMTSYDV